MTVRDEFFWLGEINKATLVINSRQGLLPMPIAKEAAKALREVLADGDADPTKRAKTYITFEPLSGSYTNLYIASQFALQ